VEKERASMTTAEQIRRWLQLGKGQNATHVIVVCDTFNYSDYPVIVGQGEDFWEKYTSILAASMQKIREVYDLSLDIEAQLAEPRANHSPPMPEFGFLRPLDAPPLELTGEAAEWAAEVIRRRRGRAH
jgi:hypothetical protein